MIVKVEFIISATSDQNLQSLIQRSASVCSFTCSQPSNLWLLCPLFICLDGEFSTLLCSGSAGRFVAALHSHKPACFSTVLKPPAFICLWWLALLPHSMKVLGSNPPPTGPRTSMLDYFRRNIYLFYINN